MEVHNIVQEAMIKTIPKKKCKEAKWISEEILQIAEKKKNDKQRIEGKIHPSECRVPKGKRDKKLPKLCEEVQENYRTGKTREN